MVVIDVSTHQLGMVDSSGIEFFYLSQPRAEDVGIITLEHHVNNTMIIPPHTVDMTYLEVWGSVYFSGKNHAEPYYY